VTADGPAQGSLFNDAGASSSLDQFLQHGGECDISNIWWQIGADDGGTGKPTEVHMFLAGQPNEFALPARCTKEEYEYVLGRLLEHNR
jgi:hypothetical protein